MIRDLVEIAIEMIREEKLEDVADKAELNAEERLLGTLLLRLLAAARPKPATGICARGNTPTSESQSPHSRKTFVTTARR